MTKIARTFLNLAPLILIFHLVFGIITYGAMLPDIAVVGVIDEKLKLSY